MSTDRIPHLDWQPELGTDDIVGGLDDIDQCIRTILLTPKGSDPHNPPFGSNIHLYIDWPQNRVTPTWCVKLSWSSGIGSHGSTTSR